MKCLYPKKDCPYRKYVCDDKHCWDNCQWSCPYNEPMSDCEVANETWGCLYMCIYDALGSDSVCPFRMQLQRMLLNDIFRKALLKAKGKS